MENLTEICVEICEILAKYLFVFEYRINVESSMESSRLRVSHVSDPLITFLKRLPL